MSTTANRALLEKFVTFINTLDEQLAEELVSPEIELHTPLRPEPYRGPWGYIELVSVLRQSFPDIRWTLEEAIAEGDKVACRFTARGTHRGVFMGVAPTGRPVQYEAMNIYTFRDGKLTDEFALPNLLSALIQIGGLPAPERR